LADEGQVIGAAMSTANPADRRRVEMLLGTPVADSPPLADASTDRGHHDRTNPALRYPRPARGTWRPGASGTYLFWPVTSRREQAAQVTAYPITRSRPTPAPAIRADSEPTGGATRGHPRTGWADTARVAVPPLATSPVVLIGTAARW